MRGCVLRIVDLPDVGVQPSKHFWPMLVRPDPLPGQQWTAWLVWQFESASWTTAFASTPALSATGARTIQHSQAHTAS